MRFIANHHCNYIGTAYPPRGENGLRSLHQQICQSSASSIQKISVLYYLLLDHDDVHPGRSHWADSFAEETGLPKKYQILMRGLWHMDRMEFKVRPSVWFWKSLTGYQDANKRCSTVRNQKPNPPIPPHRIRRRNHHRPCPPSARQQAQLHQSERLHPSSRLLPRRPARIHLI